jgi:hypothetical protein
MPTISFAFLKIYPWLGKIRMRVDGASVRYERPIARHPIRYFFGNELNDKNRGLRNVKQDAPVWGMRFAPWAVHLAIDRRAYCDFVNRIGIGSRHLHKTNRRNEKC